MLKILMGPNVKILIIPHFPQFPLFPTWLGGISEALCVKTRNSPTYAGLHVQGTRILTVCTGHKDFSWGKEGYVNGSDTLFFFVFPVWLKKKTALSSTSQSSPFPILRLLSSDTLFAAAKPNSIALFQLKSLILIDSLSRLFR